MNASQEGLFIAMDEPKPVGTRIELMLALPDGRDLALEGTVRHVVTAKEAVAFGKTAGVGIQLDPRCAIDLMIIEQLAVNATPLPQTALPNVAPPTKPAAPAPAPSPVRPPTSAAPATKAEVCSIVGIDFGTTYSSVSVAIGDKVFLIPDEKARPLLPTVVGFPEQQKPLVGWEARGLLLTDPRRCITSPKRLIGKKFDDPSTAAALSQQACQMQRGTGGLVVANVDGVTHPIVDVCGLVFAKLKATAERGLNRPVRDVVLTVPVSFGESERASVARAAKLGGLEVVDFTMEPVAAALTQPAAAGTERIAVYDFGGGTFDFTVLERAHGRWRVLGSGGELWLGGDDFDNALGQWVADSVWRQQKVDVRQRAVEWQRVLAASEQAKRELTDVQSALVVVDQLLTHPARFDLKQPVDRATLEQRCASLVERSIDVCREVLEKARLGPKDVTTVTLTGGISRIPFVRRAVETFFGRALPTASQTQFAVAQGAGIAAALKAGRAGVVVAQTPLRPGAV